MGNGSSRDFSLEEKIETVSANVWTLYRCLNGDDGCPLSVFLYDLASPRCKRMFVENAAKYLKILRHPHIVRFHALSYSSDEAWLVTEHVTPLELLLESLTADEIIAGLFNLIEALSFLHDRGGLCHNNVGISSVFVADDGTWKLGAMECVCPFAEASSAFLLQHQSIRSEKVIAPEEKNQKISTASRCSRDVYAFGVFADYVLEYLTDLGEKVKNFQRVIQEDLLNVVPDKRPKLSVLLCDGFFRTDFIEISGFLKQITVKNDDEKRKFFRNIVEKLYNLSQRLIATRLVKPLLSRFVVLDRDACQHLIPHLLLPAVGDNRCLEYRENETNPILTEPFFQRYVIPELYKIFHVRDAHIRSVLLRHFHQYATLFDRTALTDVIFPQILLSVRDANDELVMLSLSAIAFLVPVLGGDIIVGCERHRHFYEGIPKFSSVANGHSTFASSFVPTLSQNHRPAVVSSTSADLNSTSNHNSSVTDKRQLKREEARKRLEERRRKKEEEEEEKHSSIRKDVAAMNRANVVHVTPGDKREPAMNLPEEILQISVDDRDEITHSPQSRASYDRTDSEIELEIEAELEAMKQAEEKAAGSILHTFNDTRPSVKLDWSDVSPSKHASSSQTADRANQSKGRLKLATDRTERADTETGPLDHEGGRDATTRHSAPNDQWNDAGWEDFGSSPKITPASTTKTASAFLPSTPAGVKSPASRSRSIEEPLGTGYDVMLINVKAIPTRQADEFDFFADMAPQIRPSGGGLLGILSGRVGEGGSASVLKAEKFSSEKKSRRQNVEYVRSFDVVDPAGSPENSGWDAGLDWNVDDRS